MKKFIGELSDVLFMFSFLVIVGVLAFSKPLVADENGPRNCVLIGYEAGNQLTTEENVVIIGDGIHDLNHDQKDVIFIGGKVAIGKTVFGKENSLFQILKENL